MPVLVDDRESKVTPKPRYLRIREEYGELVRSSLTCAMHVHVEVDGPDQGVRVLDGIAPWLPVLLAHQRQLAVLPRPRHRLRQLSLTALEPLALRRDA